MAKSTKQILIEQPLGYDKPVKLFMLGSHGLSWKARDQALTN